MRPVEYHCFSAVNTANQTGEHILFRHVCPAPFVLSDVLYDVPGFLIHQRLMGIFKAKLLGGGTLDPLLIFVGYCGGLQTDGMPQVDLIL